MAERRERILAAAREIIGERGYEALTMRDLARASRVTVPTIYNLIGSKQAVLFAAIEEQTERFLAAIDADEVGTPAARALSVVESCVRELLRLPSYYRTLLRLLFTSGGQPTARVSVDESLNALLRRATDELQASGQLADWVSVGPLSDRLHAHLAITSLQWAAGELGAAAFRDASVYGAALQLMAATVEPSRSELEALAIAAQKRLEHKTTRRSSRGATARSAST